MRLRRVKAAIGSVLAAVTLLSMSLTGVTAAQASDDNLALNQTVTASSYEVATTAPEKAVDGDLGTRWGTAQNKAANEWIEVGLGGTKTVKQINIDFERKDADQNITSFKVELKQGAPIPRCIRRTPAPSNRRSSCLPRRSRRPP